MRSLQRTTGCRSWLRAVACLGTLLAAGCVHTHTSCGSSTVGVPGVVDLFHTPAVQATVR